ncbi:MAG: GGDEF domain-containing protein [Vagococcus sp.]|uniref:GGDEF domain-containing protein n=1 Tax=Vagococcus sp. TaxID=1933889 RepID=UPI002FCA013D
MKLLGKQAQKMPLEIGVFILLFFCALQNIFLNEVVSPEAFMFTNIFALIGISLGLLGSSIVIVGVDFIIIAVSAFLLFFQPVVMVMSLKVFYIFSIPMYSFLAYEISQSILVRKHLVSGKEDIIRYLKNTDPITGLRSKASFVKKYEQFANSLEIRQLDDKRQLALSMYQIDFFEQYVYQDEEASKEVLKSIAESLIYTRYPEELIFHISDGVFVVLSTIHQSEEELMTWQKMNGITTTQLSQIPYKNDEGTHDITIKKGEIVLLPDEALTQEKVLSKLYRQTEADLSAEYIV